MRLTDRGYKQMCKLADERDGYVCIICQKPGVQHHHVIFRSKCGSDTLDNLVCLCPDCHARYAHGDHKVYWRGQFETYLRSRHCRIFAYRHRRRVRGIIRRCRKR